MFEGFARKKVATGDITINCVVGGKGPPVLLLHGYPQTHVMWARVAPLLADTFTVVCADLRGYGDSSKPHCAPDKSTYSFRAMAADQVAVMKSLGFERFHAVGHDRGARTCYRMALDHPQAVQSLSVLDIVPTYNLFRDTTKEISGAYWHWYFLSLPEPFPETLIGKDPDFFFESTLSGFGNASLSDFDPEMFAEYKRCWRNPEMIHAGCADYRAGATIDMEHDTADLERKIDCPNLAFWGSKGVMHKYFDIAAVWRKRCTNLRAESLPGGHFFVEKFPKETAAILADFLKG
jgi:haloacetate dehalogenase